MAQPAQPARLNWREGTVVDLVQEATRTRSIVLDVPDWGGHLAGQHVDVRLTDETGYQAQRSYSLASAPEDGYLVLTVQRLDDGEVSRYLTDELQVGDIVEFRGPIGGYFIWTDPGSRPTQLIAGGSGIVPFRAVLRHRAATACAAPVRLLYSVRSPEDTIYHDELRRFAAYDEIDIHFAFTRSSPASWRGHRGRVDRTFLRRTAWPAGDRPLVLVCGPSEFVETLANLLVEAGHRPTDLKTERFGPTGE